jgi:hypothetical protein
MTVQRLGKNIGGYHGETIGIPRVLLDIDKAAMAANWARDAVALPSSTAARPLEFVAYRRILESAQKNIYISTGIHGDEPAGPLAALRLLTENKWPSDASIWLCPCLNPTGFSLNRRENYQGIDLNRDYRHFQSEEIRTHRDWLKQQPNFDIALCLHEDWESSGFYAYEVNPDHKPSLAEKIIEAVREVCPIEAGPMVDDWEVTEGIVRPNVKPEERPNWPEALYLMMNKSRLGYTLEAPSDFPLPTRVDALVTGVRRVLELV